MTNTLAAGWLAGVGVVILITLWILSWWSENSEQIRAGWICDSQGHQWTDWVGEQFYNSTIEKWFWGRTRICKRCHREEAQYE